MTTTTTRLLMPVLLLAAAAGVILVTQGGDDTPPPAPPPAGNEIRIGDGTTDQPAPGPISAWTSGGREKADSPERYEVDGDQTASDSPQGVRGVVLGPNGAPQADLPVYLLESVQNNPIARWQALQRGVHFPPAAQGVTARDGSFRLGIRDGVDKLYELRVLSEALADHTVPDITIQRGDWFDAGRIVLSRGIVLHGRVKIEGTELPVPGARVTVRSPNSFEDISQYGLPGRELGLGAEVDPSGSYRITNAPPIGVAHVSAVAPGFARVTHTNVKLDQDRDGFEEINFELPRGVTIQGVVTDARGGSIADAVVTASAVSSEDPQTEQVFTDRTGNFEVPGLRDGLYQVTATAPDYQTRTEKGVAGGTVGLRLILERKGIARVRVLNDQGGYLDRYTLNVRRYFSHNGAIGTVLNVPQQNIRTGDLENHVATVRGLDDGVYVFQVEADGYAKTLSEPFEIGKGGDDPLLELRMNRGAVLAGTVTDVRGNPIAGASVRTQTDGIVEDNPFYRMVAPMVPDKVTVKRTATDSSGRFRLEHLAFGAYQLKVEHDDFCEKVVGGLQLDATEPMQLPPIRLDRGTLVRGTASVNGRRVGQIRVVVATPTDNAREGATLGGGRGFHTEAVSDNSGNFTLPKRLPPGTYEIKAAQQTEGGVFLMAVQYKQTARIFAVTPGQEEYEHNINIVVDR